MGSKSDEKKYMEGNYSSNIFIAAGEWWEDVKQANEIVNTVAYFEMYMAYLKAKAEEHHYLVDGAVLTCTRCKGESDDYNGETFCVPEGITERKLKVTQNNTVVNGAGQCFATVNDSKKNVNIFSFGNCKNPPDRDKEREALIYASENEELRKLGTCQYLMDLNDKWENLISDTGYERVKAANGELVDTITMEAILFCKHGGLIYPKSSGYIKTDAVEETNELEEDLEDTEQYIEAIIGALGWTVDNEEIKKIKGILDDFGITDRNSIACFLLICITESGPEGTYSGKVDVNGKEYVDEYGRAVTEFYDGGGYGFEERGVGYIQITGKGNQLMCLQDLKVLGYYDGDIDESALGYVEELRELSWEASAWRWAIYPQTGMGNLNAYVEVKSNENDKKLTSGIVLTAESFINGIVSTDVNPGIIIGEKPNENCKTINGALSEIASGEIIYGTDEKNWHVEGTNLFVGGWKYSAPSNWTAFDDHYGTLCNLGIAMNDTNN